MSVSIGGVTATGSSTTTEGVPGPSIAGPVIAGGDSFVASRC